MRLRGQAQCVLGDLPSDRQVHYTSLVEALEERFVPPNQMDLYRVHLKERRQKASETLPELGQAIRRLVNKAYPKAPAEVRETLSTEHFLDALVNSEMRIRIKQSRPANLNQAICLAVELDALYKAEKKNEFGRAHLRGTTGTDETKSYKDNKENCRSGINQKFSRNIMYPQVDVHFCFLLEVLTPKYPRFWLHLFPPSGAQVSSCVFYWSFLCLWSPSLFFFTFHFPVTFLPTFETLSILDVTDSCISLGTSLISFNFF
jgi:hypothetical protein